MCGRYKIEECWQEYANLGALDWNEPPYPSENPFKVSSEAIRPIDRMSIVRLNDNGKLFAELRRWGSSLMVDGKTIDMATGKPKKIKRDFINAMSEKLTSATCGRGRSRNDAA